MSNVQEMEEGLQKAIDEFAGNPDNFKTKTYGMLDLKGLNKSYVEELKQLREVRRDLLSKRKWLDDAVHILEKRIEVNINAMATLGMPDVKIDEKHIDPEARKTIDNEE